MKDVFWCLKLSLVATFMVFPTGLLTLYILFKEKTHMKRGSGMKLIPEKLLKHEMCRSMVIQEEIRKIFRQHFACTEIKEPKKDN